jgi:hypothetical protein
MESPEPKGVKPRNPAGVNKTQRVKVKPAKRPKSLSEEQLQEIHKTAIKRGENGKKNPDSAVEIQLRQHNALKLRAAGASYEYIAQALNYKTVSAVSVAIEKAFSDFLIEAPEEFIKLEMMRLDRIYQTFYTKALEGDAKAADMCLKITDRRFGLYGLNRPDVHFHVGGVAKPAAGDDMATDPSGAYRAWHDGVPVLETADEIRRREEHLKFEEADFREDEDENSEFFKEKRI